MLYAAMETNPAGWWLSSSNYGTELDFDKAYNAVFGQGANIIVGSLTAFLLGQFIDVTVFHWIKKKTGEKFIWLRSTGSTLVSQLMDSFVVLFIAFYLMKTGKNGRWPLNMIFAVGIVNYAYKCFAAILLTPVIYFVHRLIDNFLGEELSAKLRAQAIAGNVEV
jgi:hypothetical protein